MFERIAERIAEKAAECAAVKIRELTEEAYSLGYEAGYAIRALKDREEQNRRLTDMYRMGKQRGREETAAEIGEIDGSWFKALTDMAEEEAAARLKVNAIAERQ